MALSEYDEARLAEDHAEMAGKLHARRKLEDAIRHYSRVLELRPELAGVWSSRGWARYQSGDLDGALADLDRAIDLDPEFVPAYGSRAWVREQVDDWHGALSDASRVAAALPDDPRSYMTRSVAHARIGDRVRALDDCTFAIELDPRSSHGYVARGWVHFEGGSLDEALEDVARAIGLGPKDDRAFDLRGQIRTARGEFEAAIEDYTRAVKIDPDEGWHPYGRAVAASCLFRWKEALSDFRKSGAAAWADPGLRDYAQLRAWMAEVRLGRGDAATGPWRKYLEGRKPVSRGDWPGRIARFMLGDLDESALFEGTRASNPRIAKEREAQAHYHVGTRRLLQGEGRSAARAFRDCLELGIPALFESSLARSELRSLEESGPG